MTRTVWSVSQRVHEVLATHCRLADDDGMRVAEIVECLPDLPLPPRRRSSVISNTLRDLIDAGLAMRTADRPFRYRTPA